MIYRWIQLSDIHFLDRNYNTDTMRDNLFSFLKSDTFKNIDYLFLTGDISNKGKISIDSTKSFIEEICKTLNIKQNQVFITPGNHDLTRNDKRNEIVKKIYNSNIPFDFVNNLESADTDILVNSQRKYFDFISEFFGNHITPQKIHRCINNDKIIIYNLNSSWISSEKNGDLVFGHQYLENLNEIDDRLRILITHYPIECFSIIQRNMLIDFLIKNQFDIYLSGHTHNSGIYEKDDVIFCNCRRLSADKSSVDNSNPGFILGNIDTENSNNRFIDFYTWINSFGKWDIDNTVRTTVQAGRYNAKLDRYPNKISKKNILLKCSITPATVIGDIIDTFNLNSVNCEIDNDGFINWESEIQKNETHFENMDNVINKIFPIAPIPSLIHLGFLLKDSSTIKIYQYDDMYEYKWVYDDKIKDFEINISSRIKKKTELITIFELSHPINTKQIKDCLGNLRKYDLLRFEALPSPQKCVCLYKNQVTKAKSEIKKYLFNEIDLLQYDRVHLFYSGPAGLAIEIGRIIQGNMWPEVYVYNFDRQYSFALVINNSCP